MHGPLFSDLYNVHFWLHFSLLFSQYRQLLQNITIDRLAYFVAGLFSRWRRVTDPLLGAHSEESF